MEARRTLMGVVLCALVLLAALVSVTQCASVHQKRAVSDDEVARICLKNTPCEWAVYVPFTRSVGHVIKNTCECPSDKVCTRTDDDLSVSAYVHRCRLPASTTS